MLRCIVVLRTNVSSSAAGFTRHLFHQVVRWSAAVLPRRAQAHSPASGGIYTVIFQMRGDRKAIGLSKVGKQRRR